MNHPLDGARLKVVRAQEHLALLKNEIASYINSNPYEVVTEKKRELQWEVTPRITIDPPLRLGTLVGDCLSNLMPALDYIIWELANKFASFKIQPPPIGQDKPTFPLFIDSERFRKNTHRLTRYQIPTPIIREIDAVQPYQRGYESLWLLYLLIGSDKHRLPTLTMSHVKGVDVVRRVGDDYSHIASAQQASMVIITDATTDNPPFTVGPDRVDSPMQMHFQASLFVALQDAAMPNEPVDRTLEQIIETVANVIPRFDKFFI